MLPPYDDCDIWMTAPPNLVRCGARMLIESADATSMRLPSRTLSTVQHTPPESLTYSTPTYSCRSHHYPIRQSRHLARFPHLAGRASTWGQAAFMRRSVCPDVVHGPNDKLRMGSHQVSDQTLFIGHHPHSCETQRTADSRKDHRPPTARMAAAQTADPGISAKHCLLRTLK